MPSVLERTIAANRSGLSRNEERMRKRMLDAYQRTLDRTKRDLEDYLQWSEAFPERGFSAYHQQRLEQLLADAERVTVQFAKDGQLVVQQAERMAIIEGAIHAQSVIAKFAAPAFRGRVPTTALGVIVSAFGPGTPVGSILDGYGAAIRGAIERHITEGVGTGRGARTIIRAIEQEIGVGYSKARLESLVRTETMNAYRSAQLQAYQSTGVRFWRWNAAKSQRTCLACLAMDGQVFPIEQPFSMSHVNCRCSASAWLPPDDFAVLTDQEQQDLGIQSGRDWFAAQSEDVQRRMIPSQDAFDAYRNGTLSLDDFVGQRTDPVWGTSIYERSGRSALSFAK